MTSVRGDNNGGVTCVHHATIKLLFDGARARQYCYYCLLKTVQNKGLYHHHYYYCHYARGRTRRAHALPLVQVFVAVVKNVRDFFFSILVRLLRAYAVSRPSSSATITKYLIIFLLGYYRHPKQPCGQTNDDSNERQSVYCVFRHCFYRGNEQTDAAAERCTRNQSISQLIGRPQQLLITMRRSVRRSLIITTVSSQISQDPSVPDLDPLDIFYDLRLLSIQCIDHPNHIMC